MDNLYILNKWNIDIIIKITINNHNIYKNKLLVISFLLLTCSVIVTLKVVII